MILVVRVLFAIRATAAAAVVHSHPEKHRRGTSEQRADEQQRAERHTRRQPDGERRRDSENDYQFIARLHFDSPIYRRASAAAYEATE